MDDFVIVAQSGLYGRIVGYSGEQYHALGVAVARVGLRENGLQRQVISIREQQGDALSVRTGTGAFGRLEILDPELRGKGGLFP